MTLQFNPASYYGAWKEGRDTSEKNKRGGIESANQLGQTLSGIGGDIRQQQMMKLMQQLREQEAQQKNREYNYIYGQPIDPNQMSVSPSQTQNAARSSFMPQGMGQVASPSPLIERFNQWRAGGMPRERAEADFMPALGREERALFYDRANPKPQTNYVIPQIDAQGNLVGTTHLPAGTKPTPFAAPQRPLTPPRGGLGNSYINKEIAKAQAEMAETRPLVASSIAEIDRILPLNDKSRGGVFGAGIQRAGSMFGIGTDSEEFRNTTDVINTMQGLVSRILKSTFGGQLSDSEREYLNEVYGALPKLQPQERKIAMQNVRNMLANKLAASESKFNELSQGIDGRGMGVPSGQTINSIPSNNDPLGLGL